MSPNSASGGGLARMRAWIPAIAIALAVSSAPTAGARAQSTPSPELGAEVAHQWCGYCHAIGGDRAVDVGPPFSDIAARRSPDYLRGFLANPHSRNWMPPFSHLTREQIEGVVAFIMTMK